MDLQLTNKRVLVTGSSFGIGKSIAEGFLREGSKVFLTGRNLSRLQETYDSFKNLYGEKNVFREVCDFSDEKNVQKLSADIERVWSSVDIVISNVGSGKSVKDPVPSKDNWNKVWSSNFESALYTARYFVPLLKKSSGNLLFISSIAGIEAFGAPVDYSTAKSAVIAFSKNLARQLKTVRVNVIAPGNVLFDGGSWDHKIKLDRIKIDNLIERTVPLNRFASPSEISDAALFLTSDRAKFITGATLVVDGGQTLGVL